MRGLHLVGFNDSRQLVRKEKNLRRFCAHFGAKPNVYAVIWTDLQTTMIEEASVDIQNDATRLEDLLMAAHFLKCYPKEEEAEGIFKLSDRTIRNKVWAYVKKLQALKQEKIVWPDHWNPTESGANPETTFTITVDGIHCRIGEPQHGTYSKNPKFYSHKFKQAGLDYEVAMSTFENKCVWINGPFPAGKNDVSVFRAALNQRMGNGKLGIADKGYRGEGDLLAVPTSHDTPDVREFKSRALARHEKFNGQLKNFGCLSNQFRHDLSKHQPCFEAVAVICQYQLENGSPLITV